MKKAQGFTLLELILVVVVLSIVLGIGLPKLGSFLAADELKASALRLMAALNDARNKAMLEQRYFRVYLEVGTPNLSIERVESVRDEASKKAAKKISDSVIVKGLWVKGKEILREGEALLTFSPTGYSEAFCIYLEDSMGREFSIGMNAFGTYLLLSEGAVGPEDL